MATVGTPCRPTLVRLLGSLVALTWLALAPCASAHDLWLEPTTRHARVGQALGVTVRIGQDFRGDAVSLAGGELGELYLADASGRTPLIVVRNTRPTAVARVPRAGSQVLVYRSLPIDITLPPETFNTYLSLEGLEAVRAERERRGESTSEAHESYTRCAKALLTSGTSSAAPMDHRVGLPLELVATQAIDGRDGQTTFQLLFDGRPLPGALVVAMHRGGDGAADRSLAQRSGANGDVSFALADNGEWLVKAVHMLPSTGNAWRSWWASLTFDVPAAHRAPHQAPQQEAALLAATLATN